jgi:DNA-binding response OmpR family regulator
MKILAVEDDPVALTVLEDTLKSLGHEVVVANDGESGWKLLQAQGCRVVVSDWSMPKLDGLGLCQRIRTQPGDYVYFILLTSAEATTAHRDHAMSAGVDDFLSKPVDREDLKIRLHVADRILQYTTHIQQLESLIPICSYCKGVRKDASYWQRIETYLAEKTGADCSHSVCPDCYKKHVIPEFEAMGIKNYPAELKSRQPEARRVD